jgi:hypothetical protein
LSEATIFHILGAAAGAVWSLVAIEAYTLGLEPPSADPLGVVRAVIYLPLLGAMALSQLEVNVDPFALIVGLGMLAGLLISGLLRWRLDV